MDILGEWQRLRRIERRLVELKALFFRPTRDELSWHTNADNHAISRITNELFREVKGQYKPDDEVMAAMRNEGEDQ